MDPIIDNSLFFTSEILHTKDLSSSIISSYSPSSNTINDDDVRNIIICHKDKTSFYKATRRSRRTAQRVWSALFTDHYQYENKSIDIKVCDGYYVGKKQSNVDSDYSNQGSQDNVDGAIHKRLITEFGPCIDVIDVCEDDLKVIKFNSDNLRGNNNDCQSGEEMSTNESEVDVIFFNLDSVENSTMQQQIHFDLMQNVFTTLIQKVSGKGMKNFIIHLKSETFYHAVTSKNGSGQNHQACCISGVELQQYMLSNGGSGNNDESINTDATPIRRLRDKKGAANCPLTIYPARYIEIPSSSCASSSDGSEQTNEICRFYNYDSERGCLRSKKAQQNSKVKGCDMDHDHCHKCGDRGHRAFECPNSANRQVEGSVVFRKTENGMISIPFDQHNTTTIGSASRDSTSLPALLVLGGRLRGRTLATCEMLPLSSSSTSNSNDEQQSWISLPNLREHRGSHAACSAVGCGVVFVMGGGTADGNSDDVEILNFGSTKQQKQTSLVKDDAQESVNKTGSEWRWHTMAGKLSSPRHAFGAVSCVTSKQTINNDVPMTSVSLFAVGGWKYGSVSCESMERLTFHLPRSEDITSSEHRIDLEWLYNHAQWELCAPLLLPRRLHSVAASADGSSIYVFGGYVDERRTTSSIERYDITTDSWSELDDLPFGQHNCPLVQAVADGNSFLVFPYSTERSKECNNGVLPMVLRYTPGADVPFSPINVPNNDYEQYLRLPIASWHSFSVTKSTSLNKVYLVGGTIKGKWTNRSYELDLITLEWKEMPKMTFARRRLATIVLERC